MDLLVLIENLYENNEIHSLGSDESNNLWANLSFLLSPSTTSHQSEQQSHLNFLPSSLLHSCKTTEQETYLFHLLTELESRGIHVKPDLSEQQMIECGISLALLTTLEDSFTRIIQLQHSSTPSMTQYQRNEQSRSQVQNIKKVLNYDFFETSNPTNDMKLLDFDKHQRYEEILHSKEFPQTTSLLENAPCKSIKKTKQSENPASHCILSYDFILHMCILLGRFMNSIEVNADQHLKTFTPSLSHYFLNLISSKQKEKLPESHPISQNYIPLTDQNPDTILTATTTPKKPNMLLTTPHALKFLEAHGLSFDKLSEQTTESTSGYNSVTAKQIQNEKNNQYIQRINETHETLDSLQQPMQESFVKDVCSNPIENLFDYFNMQQKNSSDHKRHSIDHTGLHIVESPRLKKQQKQQNILQKQNNQYQLGISSEYLELHNRKNHSCIEQGQFEFQSSQFIIQKLDTEKRRYQLYSLEQSAQIATLNQMYSDLKQEYDALLSSLNIYIDQNNLNNQEKQHEIPSIHSRSASAPIPQQDWYNDQPQNFEVLLLEEQEYQEETLAFGEKENLFADGMSGMSLKMNPMLTEMFSGVMNEFSSLNANDSDYNRQNIHRQILTIQNGEIACLESIETLEEENEVGGIVSSYNNEINVENSHCNSDSNQPLLFNYVPIKEIWDKSVEFLKSSQERNNSGKSKSKKGTEKKSKGMIKKANEQKINRNNIIVLSFAIPFLISLPLLYHFY